MNDNMQTAYQRALAVKDAHEDELLKKANVVGVAVGIRKRGGDYTNEVALVVMVRQKVPREQLAPADRIPHTIEGVPIDVQQVGDITIQD